MANKRLKRTPLCDLHRELGAKMVDFAGWSMPMQYKSGIMNEHKQCREKAVLFDVSHMGQVTLRPTAKASEKLQVLTPAALTTLKPGHARYTVFTNKNGGIIDDLIVSNAGDHLFVVVNASMRHQDIAHMHKYLDDIEITEITDHALIALQGPEAENILKELCLPAADMVFMQTMWANILGVKCRIARLGYTGEDGYEISIPENNADKIVRAILAHKDCTAAGLGARDSLRLEAGLCLYGNDITAQTSPIEASLLWSIPKNRRKTGGFLGAPRILAQIANGATRKLVGIKPLGRALARAGTAICDQNDHNIGTVTSGGFGPSVNHPVAMGYVSKQYSIPGIQVNLIIRKKKQAAEVVQLPFVKQNYKR